MKTLTNLECYIPNEAESQQLALFFLDVKSAADLPEDWVKKTIDDGTQFLKSDRNEDWYISQSGFAAETMKISYDMNGVIRSANIDISMLWPLNQSVTEVAVDSLSEGFSSDGKWQYVEGVITPVPINHGSISEVKKAALMAEATQQIELLADAIELGRAKVGDENQLKSWKAYRLDLNELDTSVLTTIAWPVKP